MGKGKKLGRILIGNLSSDVDETSIRDLFKNTAGKIISVDIPLQLNGKGRGYALVQMSNQEETDIAISQLDGSELCGRRITVSSEDAAEPKAKKRGRFFFN